MKSENSNDFIYYDLFRNGLNQELYGTKAYNFTPLRIVSAPFLIIPIIPSNICCPSSETEKLSFTKNSNRLSVLCLYLTFVLVQHKNPSTEYDAVTKILFLFMEKNS